MATSKLATFATKQEAFDFLKGIEHLSISSDGKYFCPKCPYQTAWGEYSMPEYKPRKYKDGWGIHCERFFYEGSIHAVKSGRMDDQSLIDTFFA